MAEREKVILCSEEEVEILKGENSKDIQEHSNWSKRGVIKPVNGKWILPKEFIEFDKIIYNFPFRPADVFVNGFPKSGTTWTQEIIWNILHNADLNHPMQNENVFVKMPWFEGDIMRKYVTSWFFTSLSNLYHTSVLPNYMDMFEAIPDSRILKTHLHPATINPKMLEVSKIVYVVRNPMDSFYSYYLYHRYMSRPLGLTKELAEFTDTYISGEVVYGNAVEHIRNWWPYRQHRNFFLIFYEDLIKDPAAEIKKLATFLQKDLTDEQIQNVVHRSSFKKMKEVLSETEPEMNEHYGVEISEEQSSFLRIGRVGDSKNIPSDIVYKKLSAFFKESLKDLDLPYKFN